MSRFAPLRRPLAVVMGAARSFSRNDGLAMASHVALSLVIALFPFLMCVAALAAFLGAGRVSGPIIHILFDFWPEGVAGPLAKEANRVLVPRSGVLTVSLIVTVLVATNGVESLRAALDRAYGGSQSRSWWRNRLIGVGFVLAGAIALVLLSVLIILWPPIWRTIISSMPDLRAFRGTSDLVRYALATIALVAGLVAAHLWLPGARTRLREVLPGVVVTLVLWLAGATLFGEFLAHFSHLKSTYASLAGILTALIFMQLSAAIFIFGAELNAAIRRNRDLSGGFHDIEPADGCQTLQGSPYLEHP